MDALIDRILRDTSVGWSSIHGPDHWARVERNAVHLVATCGGDQGVVRRFAWLHDCMRLDDGGDPEHGPRAAAYAAGLAPELLGLDDRQRERLIAACEQHTFARGARDPTLAACFDADRLDLTRLGAVVDPALLCTAEGRRIAAARDHALLRALPLRGT